MVCKHIPINEERSYVNAKSPPPALYKNLQLTGSKLPKSQLAQSEVHFASEGHQNSPQLIQQPMKICVKTSIIT
jgi:hypothetical protein